MLCFTDKPWHWFSGFYSFTFLHCSQENSQEEDQSSNAVLNHPWKRPVLYLIVETKNIIYLTFIIWNILVQIVIDNNKLFFDLTKLNILFNFKWIKKRYKWYILKMKCVYSTML